MIKVPYLDSVFSISRGMQSGQINMQVMKARKMKKQDFDYVHLPSCIVGISLGHFKTMVTYSNSGRPTRHHKFIEEAQAPGVDPVFYLSFHTVNTVKIFDLLVDNKKKLWTIDTRKVSSTSISDVRGSRFDARHYYLELPRVREILANKSITELVDDAMKTWAKNF